MDEDEIDLAQRLALLKSEDFNLLMLAVSAQGRNNERLFNALKAVTDARPRYGKFFDDPEERDLIESVVRICNAPEAEHWGTALAYALKRGDERRLTMLHDCLRVRVAS